MKPAGLIRFFIEHPVAADLLMLLLILSGLYSLVTIDQEIFPDFQTPAIIVTGELEGFSPERIENAVLQPLERELRGEAGIQRIETQARDGYFIATLELTRNTKLETQLTIVKSRIDSIESFPKTLENLLVYPRDDRSQLLWVHLSAERDLLSLAPLARQIQSELSLLPEVSRAELVGLPAEEIVIELDPQTVKTQGLTLNDVAEQIAGLNLAADAGELRGALPARITTRSETETLQTLATLPLYQQQTTNPQTLGELATLSRQFAEPGGISRLNGVNAIGFAIYRADSSNPMRGAEAVKTYVQQRAATLPPGIRLEAWLDESRELNSRISLISKDGILGLGLVVLVLVMLTHWRIAIWVAAGIPVVYLASVWAMTWSPIDLSINTITLFGFLIVSGILVDDALVIGESIYAEYQRQAQQPGGLSDFQQATLSGVERIAMPAVFGVLTIVAAFYPLTNLQGDIGSAVSSVAMVIIICLLFSIVESKLILPAHIAHSFRRQLQSGQLPTLRAPGDHLFNILRQRYLRLLQTVLAHPAIVVNTACALLIIALALVASGWLKTSLIPSIADFEIEAELIAPTNATFAEQDAVIRQIEQAWQQANSELRAAYDLAYDPAAYLYVTADAGQRTSIITERKPVNTNPVSSTEFIRHWRAKIPTLPADYTLSLSANADPEDGINIQLEGSNLAELQVAAAEVKQMLVNFPGVSDVRDNLSAARYEYQLELTPEAHLLGITLQQLSQQLRAALVGFEVQRIQSAVQETKVIVRLPLAARDNLNDLLNLPIRLAADTWVPLDQLATVTETAGLANINRVNGYRAVNIYANNDDALATADQIMDNLEDGYLETLIVRYPGLTYRVEGEARESDEVAISLWLAALLAFVVVYALLALPLNSYTKPFQMLAVVPFSLIGVIAAHLLLGLSLSLLSLFGAIALIGVLVNDSLLLLSRLEQSQQRDRHAAIIEACGARFRPIVITSITTFFGVMPIIFETDPEALWLVPIAVSLGFGVLFGTLVTLILLPAMLKLHEPGLKHTSSSTLAKNPYFLD